MDCKGWVIYVNCVYGELIGVCLVVVMQMFEVFLLCDFDLNQVLFWLVNLLCEGKVGFEEFCLCKLLGLLLLVKIDVYWYCLKVCVFLVVDGDKYLFYIWQISDIIVECEKQECFFCELQNVIDYLDYVFVGFFFVGKWGEIFYINVMLVGWFGVDFMIFQLGSLSLL